MARFYPQLEARHRDFIAAQKLFFTATGTVSSRLNLSPKGMDSLRVISDSRVAYLDLTGRQRNRRPPEAQWSNDNDVVQL